ncbi:hypothetical protein LWS69_02575, partial [Bordetella hinzii]|nr:hypothetical protein [Bordetella hinzii]
MSVRKRKRKRITAVERVIRPQPEGGSEVPIHRFFRGELRGVEEVVDGVFDCGHRSCPWETC